MSQLSRRTTFGGLFVCLILLAGFSSVAFANGSAFFKPASSNEKVDLVYFGTIRGTRGQNLDFVECELSNGIFDVRWENDRPGHYRSPDIGKFIKGYGEPVDPRALQITCFADGLELVSRRVPNKSQGIHEVDFVLPSIPGQVSLTDVFAESDPARNARQGHSALMWIVPGLLAFVAIGAAVRK
jgi:hypothetical protein